MTWSNFITAARHSEHGVHVYTDIDELADSVCAYLDAGFRTDAHAVVIASAAHWAHFAERLGTLGWSIDALQSDGRLRVEDAEGTLAQLMVDGMPSPQLFEEVVGGVIDSAGPGPVRAFGEMVDVLWQRGERDAAIALEELWNGLSQTRGFALLCGYELDVFDPDVQLEELPEVFRLHTHVLPGDPNRLANAVDRALAEVAGPNAGAIYLSVANDVPHDGLPRAQAVMRWLSAWSEPLGHDVLRRARKLYAG